MTIVREMFNDYLNTQIIPKFNRSNGVSILGLHKQFMIINENSVKTAFYELISLFYYCLQINIHVHYYFGFAFHQMMETQNIEWEHMDK